VKNTLDLRRNGVLSTKDSKQIDLLERVVRKEYNDYVGCLVEVNKVKELQWLLRVVCRNTDNSMLYHWFCKLALLEFKLQQGEVIHNIVIDLLPLNSSINQLLNKYNYQCSVDVVGKKKKWLFSFFYNLSINIYHNLNNYIWGSVFVKKTVPKGEVLLLDTFFSSDTIKNGVIDDRYYPGLIDNVTTVKKESVFYLPVLYGLRLPLDYFNQFKSISKISENIILKEGWLKLSDYIDAIFQSIVLPRSIVNIPKWRSLDINEIIKNELMQDQGAVSLTQSVLIERSFMRYKQSGMKLSGVIDWFENQVVDRALYLGVRKNYPNVYIKGYQGFVVGKGYVGLQPVEYEYDGGVLPDELLVMGNAYIEERKKECPKLDVLSAPAFRMQETLKFNRKNTRKKDLVVLAMPMLVTESSEIIDLALSIDLPKDLKFIIKVHPTISNKKFKQMVPKSVNNRLEFTSQPLNELFIRSHLLVTSASSVALDAVLCDVQVAILGVRTTYTNNPLEGVVSDKFWSVCYTAADLKSAIMRNTTDSSLDLSYYLKNVSQKSVNAMIENFGF